MGSLVGARDSKSAVVPHTYDRLNRPIHLWARDGSGQLLTLRERLVYGDSPEAGIAPAQGATANLLGKLFQHYDETGLVTVGSYDFNGNPLERVRLVISDAAILTVSDPPPTDWQVHAFRVDWQPPNGSTLPVPAGKLLDATAYRLN